MKHLIPGHARAGNLFTWTTAPRGPLFNPPLQLLSSPDRFAGIVGASVASSELAGAKSCLVVSSGGYPDNVCAYSATLNCCLRNSVVAAS